jgi:hypothetical protein
MLKARLPLLTYLGHRSLAVRPSCHGPAQLSTVPISHDFLIAAQNLRVIVGGSTDFR